MDPNNLKGVHVDLVVEKVELRGSIINIELDTLAAFPWAIK
jgi:hypothetical protein